MDPGLDCLDPHSQKRDIVQDDGSELRQSILVIVKIKRQVPKGTGQRS
jgi:hypothetical protein